LFFVPSHHCWWTMQTQCDSGVCWFENMKRGVLIWKKWRVV
jgi:hypothetical protein